MPILPIPVGVSEKPTADRWNVLDHLLLDNPLPYLIDPEGEMVEHRIENATLSIGFPNLAKVMVTTHGHLSVTAAFVGDFNRPETRALHLADDGSPSNFTCLAVNLCSIAATTLLFVYLNSASRERYELYTNFLTRGRPEHFLKFLRKCVPVDHHPLGEV